jgi:hypothetical protein
MKYPVLVLSLFFCSVLVSASHPGMLSYPDEPLGNKKLRMESEAADSYSPKDACPPSYVCSDAGLAAQTGPKQAEVCKYLQLITYNNGQPCEKATYPGRSGCWVEKSTKKCYIYSGALTCDTPISASDWKEYYQQGACVKSQSSTPSLAPTNAPVGKGKNKGKTTQAPTKASITLDQWCTSLQSDGYCDAALDLYYTTPVGCQTATDSHAPCKAGKDRKGRGCWGDRFGHCIVYTGKPFTCSTPFFYAGTPTRIPVYVPDEVEKAFGRAYVQNACLTPP